jgi:hypothetical protein
LGIPILLDSTLGWIIFLFNLSPLRNKGYLAKSERNCCPNSHMKTENGLES